MLQNHRTRHWAPEPFPQDSCSGTRTVVQPRGRAVALSEHNPMRQHEFHVSSSARCKACGQEEPSAERGGTGGSGERRSSLSDFDPALNPRFLPQTTRFSFYRSVSEAIYFWPSVKDQLLFVLMKMRQHWQKLQEKERGCLQVLKLPSSVTALNQEVLDGSKRAQPRALSQNADV